MSKLQTCLKQIKDRADKEDIPRLLKMLDLALNEFSEIADSVTFRCLLHDLALIAEEKK